MKRLILFLILLAFAHAQESRVLYISKLVVQPKKANGKGWDAGNGHPDLVINVYLEKAGKWRKIFTSPKLQDSLETEVYYNTKTAVPWPAALKVEVIDKDFARNDVVGTGFFSIQESDFNDDEKTISFGSVSEFSYFLSVHGTLEDHWHEMSKALKENKKELKKQAEKIEEQRVKLLEESKKLERTKEEFMKWKHQTELDLSSKEETLNMEKTAIKKKYDQLTSELKDSWEEKRLELEESFEFKKQEWEEKKDEEVAKLEQSSHNVLESQKQLETMQAKFEKKKETMQAEHAKALMEWKVRLEEEKAAWEKKVAEKATEASQWKNKSEELNTLLKTEQERNTQLSELLKAQQETSSIESKPATPKIEKVEIKPEDLLTHPPAAPEQIERNQEVSEQVIREVRRELNRAMIEIIYMLF